MVGVKKHQVPSLLHLTAIPLLQTKAHERTRAFRRAVQEQDCNSVLLQQLENKPNWGKVVEKLMERQHQLQVQGRNENEDPKTPWGWKLWLEMIASSRKTATYVEMIMSSILISMDIEGSHNLEKIDFLSPFQCSDCRQYSLDVDPIWYGDGKDECAQCCEENWPSFVAKRNEWTHFC